MISQTALALAATHPEFAHLSLRPGGLRAAIDLAGVTLALVVMVALWPQACASTDAASTDAGLPALPKPKRQWTLDPASVDATPVQRAWIALA